LFLNGSSLAFAAILAFVLAGIALGGLLAAAWAARDKTADRHAGSVALAAGVVGVVGYRIFPWFGGRAHLGGEQGAATIALLAVPLVLGTSLASGAFFTLVGVRLRRELGGESRAAGSLAFANTLGAALGPLAAGFVLLPVLGMERALFGLLASYAVVGALVFWRAGASRWVLGPSAALFALAFASFPFGEMSSRYLAASLRRWASSPEDRVLALREGSAATIAYVEHRALGEQRHLQLVTNAFSMSATSFWVRRYAKLYVYWPVAVRPRVRNALVIGYGVGNTLRALTATRELESIDVVDISREIVELGATVSHEAKTALGDPRVHIHIEDGRWFLQGAEQRWDLITGEPPPHHIAGVVNLYSREYFRLLRQRLTDGGVVTYWLHAELMTGKAARGILRAFCDAFEDCSLWHGSGVDFMLVGTNGATGPVSEERFSAQWRDPKLAPELVAVGIERPEQLGALFIADARQLRELVSADEAVVDDEPHLLRAAPRGFVEGLTEPWRDETAARQRFQTSQLIASLWPEAVRKRTLDYFDEQHLLNQLLFGVPLPGFQKDLAAVDVALTGSDVQLPVLLLLGSDPDLQRAATNRARKHPGDPDAVRHLAVGSLARRDFPRAAIEFRSLLGTPYDRSARALLTYLERRGWLTDPLSLGGTAEPR
jgi:predicted membrane-bound spermidine synthase